MGLSTDDDVTGGGGVANPWRCHKRGGGVDPSFCDKGGRGVINPRRCHKGWGVSTGVAFAMRLSLGKQLVNLLQLVKRANTPPIP